MHSMYGCSSTRKVRLDRRERATSHRRFSRASHPMWDVANDGARDAAGRGGRCEEPWCRASVLWVLRAVAMALLDSWAACCGKHMTHRPVSRRARPAALAPARAACERRQRPTCRRAARQGRRARFIARFMVCVGTLVITWWLFQVALDNLMSRHVRSRFVPTSAGGAGSGTKRMTKRGRQERFQLD